MARGGRTHDVGLLERADELARLRAAVRSNEGTCALVEGAAGIGKTSLLDAAAAEARDAGALVLQAVGAELQQRFEFGVTRQLLGPHLEELRFVGAAALARPLFDPDAAGEVRADAVVYGLHWLIGELADRRRLLVVIDDAQWADRQSLVFADHLARRIDDFPITLLLARRPGEHGAGTDILDRLAGEPAVATIEPAPLGRAGIRTVVAARMGEAADGFVEACERASGGNPFLLHELTAELGDQRVAPVDANAARVADVTPAAIARNVLARIARLGGEAVELSVAVAIFGAEAELRHAAALAALDQADAARAADALAAASVLSDGLPLQFAHPLFAAAVLQDIGTARRALLHAAAADLLATSGAAPEHVAAHLLAAEPQGSAAVAATLREAAADALARGAQEAAAAYLERALLEVPRDQSGAIGLELGKVKLALFAPDAGAVLERAAAAGLEPRAQVEAKQCLARALLLEGRADDAVKTLDDAAAVAATVDPELALHTDAELIALGQMDVLPSELVSERLSRYDAGELAGETLGQRSLLAAMAYEAARAVEPVEVAVGLARRAFAGEGSAMFAAESPPLVVGSIALTNSGELELAGRVLLEARERAVRTGSELGFATTSFLLASNARRTGALVDVETYCSDVMQTEGPTGHPLRPYAVGLLADVLLDRAGTDAARTLLEEEGLAGASHDEIFFNEVLLYRGRVRAAVGDIEGGLADLVECGRRELANGHRNPAATPWRGIAALVKLRLGAHEEAAEMAAEDLVLARRFGEPRALGLALVAAALTSDERPAIETLEEAVVMLGRSADRCEEARALTDLGAALRRSNRRREARDHLTKGLDLAAHCGAAVLAEQAATELRALGARPRRLVLSGVDALTASERRVAEMAAGGMSNAEIAQALFVTRKTVVKHLGNAYRKLDITSRGELGDVLL